MAGGSPTMRIVETSAILVKKPRKKKKQSASLCKSHTCYCHKKGAVEVKESNPITGLDRP
jgi:hypothetical protein